MIDVGEPLPPSGSEFRGPRDLFATFRPSAARGADDRERTSLARPGAFGMKGLVANSRLVRLGSLAREPEASTMAGQARALQRLTTTVAHLHGITTRLRGKLASEPAIYVANHLGYIDPLVLSSLVACSPIARHDLATWPIIGNLCRKMNVTFVDRTCVHSRARALLRVRTLLRQGVSVLNFPEGTTTRGPVIKFQAGVFGLAGRLGVPVVPMALSVEDPALCWVNDDTLLGHYLRSFVGKSHTVDVEIGPRMFKRPTEQPAEFAARAQRWVESTRAHQTAQRELSWVPPASGSTRAWALDAADLT